MLMYELLHPIMYDLFNYDVFVYSTLILNDFIPTFFILAVLIGEYMEGKP